MMRIFAAPLMKNTVGVRLGINIFMRRCETNKEVPTIEIDSDRKCSKCGKDGACKSGLCLSCILKKIASTGGLVFTVDEKQKD